MLLSSPEQRWAREALFALVQAQTQVTREALIATYRPEREKFLKSVDGKFW